MCSLGGCGLWLSRPGLLGASAFSPWVGTAGQRGNAGAGSRFPEVRLEWERGGEAGSALTSSRPEDTQVLPCCSSESVSPCAQGRSQFLPRLSLAGVEGGALGDLILQKVRACSPAEVGVRQGLGQGHMAGSLVAELTGQNSRSACFYVTLWVSQSSSLLASPTSVHPVMLANIRSVLLGRGWQGLALSFLSAPVLLRDPGCVVGCGWAWLPVIQSRPSYLSISASLPPSGAHLFPPPPPLAPLTSPLFAPKSLRNLGS